MAPLLRRRLVCFYCSHRSNQKDSVNLQRWQCETCEAINHLDENGDITDPPADETVPLQRYAQSIERPVSPIFTSPDETLFCRECIKNQHLLTQTLASYLPSSNDPKYAEYEKRFPEYRKSLEERYPQVCTWCEPRVTERIRSTGYAAKTDHLRRMMNNTRENRSSMVRWDWRLPILYAGGLGWWVALGAQVLWHALGVIGQRNGALQKQTASQSLGKCLQASLSGQPKTLNCVDLAQPLATGGLVLAFVTIWWNPCVSRKLHGTAGRMVGLSEFYKLQGILNLVRLLVCYFLGSGRGFVVDTQTFKAAHAIMLGFNIVVSLVSYRTARIDSNPSVIFQDSPQPLRFSQGVPDQSASVHAQNSSARLDIDSPRSHSRPSNTLVPTNRTATLSRGPQTYIRQAPTPPPADDTDDMDWTPAKNQFHPMRRNQVHQPGATQIPASSFNEARILQSGRSPTLYRHTLRSSSASSSRTSLDSFRQSLSTSDCEDDDDTIILPPRAELAEPKFFIPKDQTTDIGIESFFTNAFSLADDPLGFRSEPETRERQRMQETRSSTGHALWQRFVSILLLGLACLAWRYADMRVYGTQSMRLGALGVATAVIGKRISDALRADEVDWRLSEVLVLLAELSIAIFLGSVVRSFDGQGGPEESTVGRLSQLYLGVLFSQELVAFVGGIRTASSEGTAPVIAPWAYPSQDDDTGTSRSTQAQPPQESPVASSHLSGLSLGREHDRNSVQPAAQPSPWGTRRDVTARNTRYRDNIRPWERLPL